jgi:hypothetical protein
MRKKKRKQEVEGEEKEMEEVKIKNVYIKKSLLFNKCPCYTLNIFTWSQFFLTLCHP